METTITTDYSLIAAKANAAVSSVKDPELRRIAFEKILVTLLERNTANSGATNKYESVTSISRKINASNRAGISGSKGPKALLEELVVDGFFNNQKTIAAVKAELANRGHHIPLTSLSGPLQSLTREKKLRRAKVAMNEKKSKPTFAYSNW